MYFWVLLLTLCKDQKAEPYVHSHITLHSLCIPGSVRYVTEVFSQISLGETNMLMMLDYQSRVPLIHCFVSLHTLLRTPESLSSETAEQTQISQRLNLGC